MQEQTVAGRSLVFAANIRAARGHHGGFLPGNKSRYAMTDEAKGKAVPLDWAAVRGYIVSFAVMQENTAEECRRYARATWFIVRWAQGGDPDEVGPAMVDLADKFR